MSLFGIDSKAIIERVEDNLNGKSAEMDIVMEIHIHNKIRTMKLQTLSVGKSKSFIKITYPKKDRGITFLKLDSVMWQYVPKIERIIKIPASMMLQSWMGSDFTNDDLVRESSISDDYNHRLISENRELYTLKLTPKDEATVVWGRVDMNISKEYYLPLSASYYDEDGELIRVLTYKDFRKFGDRYYPTYWEIVPLLEEKRGDKTVMKIEKAKFDIEINGSYFTKHGLKRYSR